MKKYFLIFLLSVTSVGVIKAQTVMDVAGIQGESNYPFASNVHTLDLAEFEDAKQMILLALKPPSGYTPVFQTSIKKTPGLASPKFAETLLKGNTIATITIKEYGKGQFTKILKLEGATISGYALSSENYDEYFSIKADKVWYEEPAKKYKIGYDFKNKTPLK